MKISIVIPIKGRINHLKATINSLLKSFDGEDICVVESDQSPNSMQLCKDFKINYIFFPIKENKFNKCLCFNFGFLFMDKKKNYDYTLFHDADIVVKSNFYKNLMLNIVNNNYPNCMQTYGKKSLLYTTENLGKGILENSVNIDDLNENYSGIYTKYPSNCNGVFSRGGSILVKNSTYYEVGGFDHEFFYGYSPEDAYFWDKVALNNKISFADFPNIEMIHVWHKTEWDSNPEKNKLNNIYQSFCNLPINKKTEELKKAQQRLINLNEKIALRKNFVLINNLGNFGRLGNQLFQLAAAISYAKDNDLFIDVKWEKYFNYFENKVKINSCKDNYANYSEKRLSYDSIPYNGKSVNLQGYFQSEKYFKKNEKLIRHYFTPNKNIISNLLNRYPDVKEYKTCSVHIRRGDYVDNKIHNVCNLYYYNKAIEKIKSLTNIDKFIFFSDDISWCKENFKSDQHVFVENNKDIEDLFLMSHCSHNIISNSTFSWWASWLNANPEKIIIAPDKWFTDDSKLDNKDIYTENMIKISTENNGK